MREGIITNLKEAHDYGRARKEVVLCNDIADVFSHGGTETCIASPSPCTRAILKLSYLINDLFLLLGLALSFGCFGDVRSGGQVDVVFGCLWTFTERGSFRYIQLVHI